MLFFPTLNLPSERIRCEDPEGQKENPVACFEDALCYEEKTPRIYFRDRLQCFKWNWFTVVMATGGIADVIYSIPYRFKGLEAIGKMFLILNIVLFLLSCTFIIIRFTSQRGSLRKSCLEPSESLFIPASVVCIGITLINIAQYGIPATGRWLQVTFETLFWIYAALALLSSCFIYLLLWSTQEFSLQEMTPVWVFRVYPLLIVAPLAASLINSIPSTTETLHISSQTIIMGAIALQGIGFLVSVIICNAFIYRLMTHGLLSPQRLPMMFISVGPAGFTATGVIQIGSLASKAMPMTAVGNPDTVSLVVRVLAYSVGMCLWGVTMWFFILSVGGQWRLVCVKESRIHFDVSFYAYIFPNSALISSTHAVGKAFDWYPVQIMGCVMATALIAAWLLVSSKTVWAIWTRKILWP